MQKVYTVGMYILFLLTIVMFAFIKIYEITITWPISISFKNEKI